MITHSELREKFHLKPFFGTDSIGIVEGCTISSLPKWDRGDIILVTKTKEHGYITRQLHIFEGPVEDFAYSNGEWHYKCRDWRTGCMANLYPRRETIVTWTTVASAHSEAPKLSPGNLITGIDRSYVRSIYRFVNYFVPHPDDIGGLFQPKPEIFGFLEFISLDGFTLSDESQKECRPSLRPMNEFRLATKEEIEQSKVETKTTKSAELGHTMATIEDENEKS